MDIKWFFYMQLEKIFIYFIEEDIFCILFKRVLLEIFKFFYENFSFKSDGMLVVIENEMYIFFIKFIDGNYFDY